jgi:hypothetical protein
MARRRRVGSPESYIKFLRVPENYDQSFLAAEDAAMSQRSSEPFSGSL